MTQDSQFYTPAMTYGINMEKEARRAIVRQLKKAGHANVQVQQTGLSVYKYNPIIAASTDGILSCSCGGQRALEIKCPFSLAGKNLSSVKLPCCVTIKGQQQLKVTHPYYTQVQVQLACLSLETCEFFMYSRGGTFHQSIAFNDLAFCKVLRAATLFYDNYFLPFTYSQWKAQTDGTDTKSNQEVVILDNPDFMVAETVDVKTSDSGVSKRLQLQGSKKKPARKSRKKVSKPTYMCDVCTKECKHQEEIEDSEDESVQCEICFKWFHQVCVHFINNDSFQCDNCNQ